MSTMIQIRNVPERIHRALKARAARAGMTLSDYLLKEVTEVAERPSIDEWLEQVRERLPVRGGIDVARAVRTEREGR